MSTITKLTIRGIRSFGTENEDRQELEFISPLTLILGDNGCGKTTIIECIKYALTGEIPPGCSKGQSFVHDPHIFHSCECLGQVKLQVKTFKGDLITISRSMKTIVKNNNLRFETLDATISAERNGKKESISKRCMDANAEMAYEIGASKAIINNVLFCHQEESNWPLDEGKKLKEKFDAIFGTTGYNKSIEKFIKIRKTYEIQLKTKESDLKYLRHVKKENEQKQLEYTNTELKLKKIQDQILKCDEEMKPLKERLIKLQKIEREIGEIIKEKIELTTKLEGCKSNQERLLHHIKVKFNGDDAELEAEMRTFKERMKSKATLKNDKMAKLEQLQNLQVNIRGHMREVEQQRDKMLFQLEREQETVESMKEEMRKLSKKIDVQLDENKLNPIELNEENLLSMTNGFLLPVRKHVNEKMQTLRELVIEYERVDTQFQNTIDELRDKKATVQSTITSKNSQIKTLQVEQLKCSKEIQGIEQSGNQLKKINDDLEKITKIYDDCLKGINFDDMKDKIAKGREQRDTLQNRFDGIDKDVQYFTSIGKFTTEINLKRIELKNRHTEMKKLKNKHLDNFKNLSITISNIGEDNVDDDDDDVVSNDPTNNRNKTLTHQNYKQQVQIIYQRMQNELKNLTIKQQNNKKSNTILQFERKSKREDLLKMEKQLQEYEEKIYDHCKNVPYEEVLQNLKDNIAKIQMEYGELKSSDVLYKKYINKIQENPCCPLCHKEMIENDVDELTIELTDKLRCLPQNIEGIEKKLKIEQRKYEQLLGVQTLVEKIEDHKLKIPQIKNEIKEIEEKLDNVVNDIETVEMLMAEPTSTIELITSMLSDMTILDECIKDIIRMRKEINMLKLKIPERTTSTTSYDTLEEAQRERSTIMNQLRVETENIEKFQKQYESSNDMINKLRDSRTNLKDKQLKLQENMQGLGRLRDHLENVKKQIDDIKLDCTNLNTQIDPIVKEIENVFNNKKTHKDEHTKSYNTKHDEYFELNEHLSLITKSQLELTESCKFKYQENLNLKKVEYDRIVIRQKDNDNKCEELISEIDGIQKEIHEQESDERNLLDNQELKKLENREKLIRSQLAVLIENVGLMDFGSVTREKNDLTTMQDKLLEKRSEHIGQIGELKHTMKTVKGELDKPENANALKNYRKGFYEVEIIKKIITDMGQYRIALEWALMKYHSEKMDLINRTIRELWREIYRGNDIDYIQIKTDEIKSNDANRRRVFDYRVIQSKNNVEIDMRGRCSAGQRVLACLIIRMALAETFCNNCGVLALDEPTTNLDRENIYSLCCALNKILMERRGQSHYMMIIITHDKEFLNTLNKIDVHYNVFRNKNGKSVIRKATKDD